MNAPDKENMSVLLTTRHWIRNYGSVLQAYATQMMLREFASNVETLDYREVDHKLEDTATGYLGATAGLSSRVKGYAYKAFRATDARARGAVFEQFLDDRIDLTPQTYRAFSELEHFRDSRSHDYYCVGSDQVWNAHYNADSRPYFLDFAPDDASRFSLSSSIGTSNFPPAQEEIFVESLRKFRGISVREVDAADYLSSFDLPVNHHVDPTLGVSGDEWRDFASTTDNSDSYILVYQLNANPEMDKAARALARRLGVRVRRIEYWKNFRGLRSEKVVRPSVAQFVGLFIGASFVLTDSFHGCAFSANLQVPFGAFMPPKYETRISSLLQLLDLTHRRVCSGEEVLSLAAAEPVLPSVEDVLGMERAALREYLASILGSSQMRV